MKTAIVSVTVRGAKLGQAVKQRVHGVAENTSNESVICYEKNGRISTGDAVLYDSVGTLMKTLFAECDRILCIMATGIVVRVLAPLLQHKSLDPAIVVMDEGGQHAISLLSGHLGGANEWTVEIAQAIGADPVITTATDVNRLLAPDVLARKLGLQIENFNSLVAINSALVNGNAVAYYIDEALFHKNEYMALAETYGITMKPLHISNGEVADATIVQEEYKVIITDQLLSLPNHTLYLRPKTVTIGVGCRRGTAKELIKDAILESLNNQKIALKSVITAASVSLKADEEGLLAAVAELNIPITFFEQAQIAPLIATDALEESNFVKQTIGVGNVCETTALLAGKSHTLLQHKTIYPKTTVAISQANWSLSELDLAMQRK